MNQRKHECVLEGVLRPQRNAKAGYTSTAALRTSLSTFHSTPPLTTVLRVPYYLHSPQCSLYSELLAVDLQHEHESKARRHICSFSPQGIRLSMCKLRLLILTIFFENACYNKLSLEMYALPRNIVRFCGVHCTTIRVDEGCVSDSIFCRQCPGKNVVYICRRAPESKRLSSTPMSTHPCPVTSRESANPSIEQKGPSREHSTLTRLTTSPYHYLSLPASRLTSRLLFPRGSKSSLRLTDSNDHPAVYTPL